MPLLIWIIVPEVTQRTRRAIWVQLTVLFQARRHWTQYLTRACRKPFSKINWQNIYKEATQSFTDKSGWVNERRWMRQTKSLNQTYISKRDSSEVICGGSPTQKCWVQTKINVRGGTWWHSELTAGGSHVTGSDVTRPKETQKWRHLTGSHLEVAPEGL